MMSGLTYRSILFDSYDPEVGVDVEAFAAECEIPASQQAALDECWSTDDNNVSSTGVAVRTESIPSSGPAQLGNAEFHGILRVKDFLEMQEAPVLEAEGDEDDEDSESEEPSAGCGVEPGSALLNSIETTVSAAPAGYELWQAEVARQKVVEAVRRVEGGVPPLRSVDIHPDNSECPPFLSGHQSPSKSQHSVENVPDIDDLLSSPIGPRPECLTDDGMGEEEEGDGVFLFDDFKLGVAAPCTQPPDIETMPSLVFQPSQSLNFQEFDSPEAEAVGSGGNGQGTEGGPGYREEEMWQELDAQAPEPRWGDGGEMGGGCGAEYGDETLRQEVSGSVDGAAWGSDAVRVGASGAKARDTQLLHDVGVIEEAAHALSGRRGHVWGGRGDGEAVLVQDIHLTKASAYGGAGERVGKEAGAQNKEVALQRKVGVSGVAVAPEEEWRLGVQRREKEVAKLWESDALEVTAMKSSDPGLGSWTGVKERDVDGRRDPGSPSTAAPVVADDRVPAGVAVGENSNCGSHQGVGTTCEGGTEKDGGCVVLRGAAAESVKVEHRKDACTSDVAAHGHQTVIGSAPVAGHTERGRHVGTLIFAAVKIKAAGHAQARWTAANNLDDVGPRRVGSISEAAASGDGAGAGGDGMGAGINAENGCGEFDGHLATCEAPLGRNAGGGARVDNEDGGRHPTAGAPQSGAYGDVANTVPGAGLRDVGELQATEDRADGHGGGIHAGYRHGNGAPRQDSITAIGRSLRPADQGVAITIAYENGGAIGMQEVENSGSVAGHAANARGAVHAEAKSPVGARKRVGAGTVMEMVDAGGRVAQGTASVGAGAKFSAGNGDGAYQTTGVPTETVAFRIVGDELNPGIVGWTGAVPCRQQSNPAQAKVLSTASEAQGERVGTRRGDAALGPETSVNVGPKDGGHRLRAGGAAGGESVGGRQTSTSDGHVRAAATINGKADVAATCAKLRVITPRWAILSSDGQVRSTGTVTKNKGTAARQPDRNVPGRATSSAGGHARASETVTENGNATQRHRFDTPVHRGSSADESVRAAETVTENGNATQRQYLGTPLRATSSADGHARASGTVTENGNAASQLHLDTPLRATCTADDSARDSETVTENGHPANQRLRMTPVRGRSTAAGDPQAWGTSTGTGSGDAAPGVHVSETKAAHARVAHARAAGGQGSGAQGDDCIVVDSSSDDDIQIVSVTAGKQPWAGNRAAASTLQLSRADEAIRRGESGAAGPSGTAEVTKKRRLGVEDSLGPRAKRYETASGPLKGLTSGDRLSLPRRVSVAAPAAAAPSAAASNAKSCHRMEQPAQPAAKGRLTGMDLVRLRWKY